MSAARFCALLVCFLLVPPSYALAYDGETEILLDGDQAFVVPRGGTIDDALIFPPREDLPGGPRGAAARTIEVAVVYDAQFAALYGGDAEGRVCAMMAEARARMAELDSVDVDLAHIHLEALGAVPEPLASTTDPTTLLVEFRDWAAANLPPYDTALLLTGRDLDGSTVGFAFTGATCTVNGAAIAEGRKSVAFDGALISHELGHSFGLCHDPPAGRNPSVCADLSAIVDPPTTCSGFIMEAVSNVLDPQTEYSQCSGEDLAYATTTLGVGACLNNAPVGDLDAACQGVPPPTSLCTAVPRQDCLAAGKSVFQYKLGNEPAKNKMKWLWAKGAAVDPLNLGDPVSLSSYEICQYDGLDGGTTYEGLGTTLPGGAAWKATGTTGYAYKDKDAGVDGLKIVKIKAGADGKSKVLVKAQGAGVLFPTGGMSSMVVQDPAVQIQLVNDVLCWDSTFVPADVKKDEADQFKAIVK